QLFPLAPIGYLTGANEQIYGMKKRGDRTVSIVTSGISDWAIDYKTGTYSEYVIIDVQSKEK
ncbi:MAG: metallophosphoesterase, partial [Lachnospiraceae bacterium]|nr:metallophosphoesterase [Lachnospiraceae bacterium]